MAFVANEELDFTVNKLILGDNLEILKNIPDECVDLIYLDPPFFSNQNYEVIWGDAGEIRSFQDRWSGGIDHYIGWLYERVEQMQRILKPAGSIYLHCDWHANAEIKVFILNKIFGDRNFRNEIAWHYIMGASARSSFGEKFDTIYWYSKTRDYIFNLNEVRVPYNPETIARSRRGEARYNTVLTEKDGKNPGNVWSDIHPIQGNGKERIGYPTQKPEALLERIIKASSNKGDVVLDPFMGGGTTIAVAEKLGRQWIGIDQSVMAIKVTEFRLEKQYGTIEQHKTLFPSPYTVHLHKYDEETLFTEDPFKFETWIIQQFGGIAQNKKGGDAGVDGKTKDGTPIQVKQSRDIGVNVVKNFFVSAKQYNKYRFDKNVSEKSPVGYIIAFSFGRGAIQEAARLKNTENVIIKLVTVNEIVPLSVKPTVAIHVNDLGKNEKDERKIEFTAAGNSLSGIEFYSWDFEYNIEKNKFKPQVIMDKDGKQITALEIGTHNIAVKVVDNDGLENIEIIKLKINGGISRE
jgi:DNA modification methylase